MNASTPHTSSNPKPGPGARPDPPSEAIRDGASCSDSESDPDLGLGLALEPEPNPDPDMAYLRRTYGHHWCIWRTPNWWMATARINGVTPTLMERTPDDLERRLRNPGRQIGGPIAT